MRTTIEISDEMRAKLLALAARRGLRGYSEIVSEALSLYLERETQKERDLADILDLAGSLSNAEAEEAAQNIKEFRKRWDSSWIHP
jgi:metal-responsive CopG/Arc/MetJ family transcriptional regulator